MSNEKNDGGPAFPFMYDVENESNMVPHTGMSLRDHFAGLAMQGLISATNAEGEWTSPADIQLGERAYRVADAMLKAREQ